MSLYPQCDILAKEIESWSEFTDSLHTDDDRNLFKKMLNEVYKYSVSINAKGVKMLVCTPY